MDVTHKRTHAQATDQQKESCGSLRVHMYIETATNSYMYMYLFYLKYIPKVLQGPLKGQESR